MNFEFLSKAKRWQLVLILITAMLINSNVFGATITVDGVDGTVLDDGVCTINEAIESANSDTAVDSCQAGSGSDIIELSADITINSFYENYPTFGKTGINVITSPIIIDGLGHFLKRDESLACSIENDNNANEFRLFLITGDNDTTFKNITLQNGCADGAAFEAQGGAILNLSSGKLVLTSSSFISNEAFFGGGIHNYGIVSMIESTTFDSNSGIDGSAIYNDVAGIDKIYGSVFINNHSRTNGGGVFSKGTIGEINNSIFSLNESGSAGGGIFNNGTIDEITNSLFSLNESGFGGGVDNRNVITTIVNSTFSDNIASLDGGGLFAQDDSSIGTIKNTTFSNNTGNFGGGFYNFNNTLTEFLNNTFANNNAVFEGGGIFNRGTISNFGNSLFHNNTANAFADCRIAAGSINGSNNLSNQSSSNCGNLITPNSISTGTIGILTDNGCVTPLADDNCIPSHALMLNSEAIDAGDINATPVDQRGLLAEGQRDIGAFEFGATVSDLIFKDDFE